MAQGNSAIVLRVNTILQECQYSVCYSLSIVDRAPPTWTVKE